MKGGSMAPLMAQSGNAVMLRYYESEDGALEIWPTTKKANKTDDGKECQKLCLNTLYLKFACISGSGNLVGTSTENETETKIQIWDVKKTKVITTLATQLGNVSDMKFANDDENLIITRQNYTDGKNWSVSCYKVDSGDEIFLTDGIRANCAWTHECGRIVCVQDGDKDDNNPHVQVIDGLTGDSVATHSTIPDHNFPVDSVTMVNFDASGSRMIDFHRKVIDVCSGEILYHFEPTAKPHVKNLKQRSPKLTYDGNYAIWVDSKMSSIKVK